MSSDDCYFDKVLADGTVVPGCRRDLANAGEFLMRGWSVFPLRNRDKRPAIRSWVEYQHRPPTYDELEQWFTGAVRNVAIVTGKVSGLFVVDADSPAALAWAAEHLPPTEMRVRTAKGCHLFYPYSGERPMRNKCRVRYAGETLDLDVRADGGYVVGPGSIHPSGHVYTREGRGWL